MKMNFHIQSMYRGKAMIQTEATSNGNNPIEKLSRRQIVDILEIKARKRLGISARKLFQKYRAGKLDDIGEVADLIILSSGLSKNDPLFV